PPLTWVRFSRKRHDGELSAPVAFHFGPRPRSVTLARFSTRPGRAIRSAFTPEASGMKFGWSLALAALLTTGSALAQDLTSDKGKVSYAIGYQIGAGLAERGMEVDINTVTRAVQDAFAKKPPAVPEQA